MMTILAGYAYRVSPWLTEERWDTIRAVLQRHNVQRAGIFGSFARGEARENSDLDLVFEPAADADLFTLAQIAYSLTESVGQHIDAIPFESLHPRLRDRIMHDYIELWPNEVLQQG